MMPVVETEPIEVYWEPSAFNFPLAPPNPTLSCVERLAAAILLLVAIPVILVSAIIVRVLSRRSPFVAHLRVGQYGAELWILKLRTMWSTSLSQPSEQGLVERIVAEPASDQKRADDARITSRFAAYCRRHSIDELPQLLHVIGGEMSLVGPRPVTASELLKHYGAQVPTLLTLKPGLTGWWQTEGRGTVGWRQRVLLDLEHARMHSAGTYLGILWRTLPLLISGKGAW